MDDAYISFRYALHLVAGQGLVYNPGQAVLGTTTPLYTVILAAGSSLLGTADLPHLAWILNALLDAAGVALMLWLGRKLTGSQTVGLGAALLWAVAPYSVTFAVGGLETSLVITLLLAAFALYLAGRDNWAALALALGVLTRPDVLIAALLILGAMLVRTWGKASGQSSRLTMRLRWAVAPPALIFLATLLPWLLYAALTYGGPLPHSLAAKTIAYHLPPEAALVRLLQHYATPFHEHLIFGGRWVVLGLILYGALFGIGALHTVQGNQRAWPLFLYPLFYAAIYAVANPLIFRWYLSPPLPFYILGIMAGVCALLSPRPGKQRAGGVAIAITLALASLANAWSWHPPSPQMAWIELEALYQQAALDLQDELAAGGGTLAAGDIGALGWFTGAPILDLVGLVSPQAQAYYPLPAQAYVINYAVSSDYVLAERPEFLVILEVYGRNTLLQDGRFLAEYQLWHSYPTDIYGSDGMLVYQRTR